MHFGGFYTYVRDVGEDAEPGLAWPPPRAHQQHLYGLSPPAAGPRSTKHIAVVKQLKHSNGAKLLKARIKAQRATNTHTRECTSHVISHIACHVDACKDISQVTRIGITLELHWNADIGCIAM